MARRLIPPVSFQFLVSTPTRAALEAGGLGFGLLAFTWLMRHDSSPGEQQNGLFIALLSTVSWYGIRLRRSRASWRRRVLFEIGIGFVIALGLGGLIWLSGATLLSGMYQRSGQAGLMAVSGVILRAFELVIIHGESWPRTSDTLTWPPVPTIVFISGVIAFVVMRGGIHVWQFWARLRRQHLLWSLTHSHMMLVILGLFLLATITTINNAVIVSEENAQASVPGIIFLVSVGFLVPLLIVIGFLTMVLVVVALPPSLALSYFAARRTTRRLRQLTEATASLRQGDYTTQVTVQGEDEVAALQTDFNVMAHALDSAMRDVQTERDNVAKLLHNRRELVASVSHELRTPVAILRGHLESMQYRWREQLPAELVQDVAVMEAETLRLQRLIDDLFTLSRVEVGELAITCQPTDLPDVIRRITAAAAPVLWQTYKVELVVDLPDNLPPAQVDAMRVEQILHNLLRNAVRHTPPGGIVAVSAVATDDHVSLQVKDTGEGIAPAHLPHIWDRFYRAGQRHDQSGAGLGLALVKDLTEAMGGTVDVSSTVGLGSTFSICLPRA
ncbi:MAG: HAMP domain-containing protein [Anaerolineae bacterium]|nr:HAMP domain-containing protein [Anaerolineae bacterium]